MELRSLTKRDEYEWEIPKQGCMNVPGRIFATKALLEEMDEKVREQISNVACLPGIQRAAIAMPDAHWGYGFPIGGVGAFDPEENGVICMGGIGFDISCGVRTMRTGMSIDELKPKIERLVEELYRRVPAGLGSKGKLHLSMQGIDEVLRGGAVWAVEKGYGYEEDLEYIEEHGRMEGAKPENVSERAKRRQLHEVGTLGSGNHYLEVQYVSEVYDEAAARVYGLEKGSVVVSVHCGSRALGHQIGMDYIKELYKAAKKYGIPIRDKELACAPINSPEGERYFSAVAAGINCALANRQVISHLVRQVFEDVVPEAEVEMLYDISHNTCKPEEHEVEGRRRLLYVHRKGSTRALGPGRKEVPREYRSVGQPVLIGGTMGTCSFILRGTEDGLEKAFGSACHGAGRAMSRKQAKRVYRGERVVQELRAKGIIVRAHSWAGVAEEAPGAYKDVEKVVDAVHAAKLAYKVVKLKPVACVKG
ncbi:MAG: RtcB family protein [Euryarchaeota archaeon]|nr:RtcB family protein [Euryarchaeota archaeon]